MQTRCAGPAKESSGVLPDSRDGTRGPGEFAERERPRRGTSPDGAAEGIARVIYLGGLGDRPGSRTFAAGTHRAPLRADGPPLTYFRAGMVVGQQSESYRTLRYLVQRLPAMIGPAWLKTRLSRSGSTT